MAQAGLQAPNPFLAGDTQVGEPPNPFYVGGATGAQLAPSIGEMAVLGAQLSAPQFQMPTYEQGPAVMFSPSQQKVYVNGVSFAIDDHAAALDSESRLNGPSVGTPQGGDWVYVDRTTYGNYINDIKNPSMTRLASKNFGIGVDNMQMLAGRGLQFLGAEETGQGIVDRQLGTDTIRGDLQKTAPYQREFSDIGTSPYGKERGVLDWFVANLAQQGPNMIESAVTAAAGFAAGTATTGVGGVPAALAALAGKAEAKAAITAAAKKYATGTATDAELKVLRNAAGMYGAAAASLAQNYATGVADIYGEMRDQGQDGAGARAAAMFGAVPYAALESLPEFALASRVLGSSKGIGAAWGTAPGASRLQRGAGYAGRFGAGAAVGGTLEGMTETGQEALLLGLSGQDLSSPENQKRLVESFAAGFGVGAPLGGVANLRRGPVGGATGKAPDNLLQPENSPEPNAPSNSTDTTLVGEPVNIGGMGARADFVSGADGTRATTPGDRIYTGEVPPGQFNGPQGVLDLGGAPINELQQRSRQTGASTQPVWDASIQGYRDVSPQELAAQIGPQQPYTDPNQGALQFAPPAPAGVGFTDQQQQTPVNPVMEQQMNLAQSRQAQIQAQQQAAQQREADLQRLAVQAENQRQLDIAAAAQAQANQPVPQPPMPMRPVPIRQPQQLPLFTNKQAPRPSRAEGLRRGVGEQPTNQPVAMPTPTPGEFQRAGQLSLFTQQGQPTVAALKSAGKPQQVVPTVQAGATQAPPTGAVVTPASTAAAKAKLKRGSGTVTYEDGSSYSGQLKDGSPNGQGTMVYEDGSKYVGQFKDGVIHGQGKYQDADGTTMEGKFVNGEFQGTPTAPAQEKVNAVQKRGAEKVSPRKGTKAGGGVGQEVQGKGEAAGKGEALKTKGKQGVPQDVRKDLTAELNQALDAYAQYVRSRNSLVAKGKDTTQVDASIRAVEARIKELGGTVPTEPTPPKGGKSLKKTTTKTEAKGEAAPKGAALQKGPSGMAAMVNQLIGEKSQAPVIPEKKQSQSMLSGGAEEDNQKVRSAIETLRTTKDAGKREDAINALAYIWVTVTDNARLARKMVAEFLADDTAQGAVSTAELAAQIREIAAGWGPINKRSNLYMLLQAHGLLNDPDIAKMVREPAAKAKQAVVIDEPVGNENTQIHEQRLADLINNRDGYMSEKQLREKAAKFYALISDDSFTVGPRGRIRDFFDVDGSPITVQIAGKDRFVMTTEREQKLTKAEYTEKHNEARKVLRDLENEETQQTLDDLQYDPLLDNVISNTSFGSDVDGRYFRTDGKPLQAMKVGPLKMLVARIVSKYAKPMKVAVFSNLADMKAKNPALFRAAAAARKAGDLEHVNASGMAWGNNVVLFADFIGTEQQARFIIAHETLGHVGFRGLFTNSEVNRIMQTILDSDAQVRAAAEVYAQTNGVSMLEAAEEVMADRAAAVDTNTILKLWNWFKNQLNKLGFKFNDDAARYLISLSRKYVRQGVGRSEVNLSGIFKEIEASLAHESSDIEALRFSIATPSALPMDMFNRLNLSAANGGLGDSVDIIRNANSKLGAIRGEARKKAGDMMGKVGDFLGGLQTMDNLARKSRGFAQIFAKTQEKASMQSRLQTMFSEGTKTAHLAKMFGLGEGATKDELQRAGQLMAFGTLLRMNQYTDTQLNKEEDVVFYDADLGVGVNNEALERLADMGEITFEEFKRGFKVQQGTTEVPMTDVHRRDLEAQRDMELDENSELRDKALARLDDMIATEANDLTKSKLEIKRKEAVVRYNNNEKSIKARYTKLLAAPTYEVPNMVDTPSWFADLKEDGVEFKIFNEFRTTLIQSHIETLKAKMTGATYEQTRTVTRGTDKAFNRELTAEEHAFIRSAAEKYEAMMMDGSKLKDNRRVYLKESEDAAKQFLHKRFVRAFYNDLALDDLTKLMSGYTPQEVTAMVTNLRKALRVKIDPEVDDTNSSSAWALARGIEERSMFTKSLLDDQLGTKRSIAGMYVPLSRRGNFMVRVQAYMTDEEGNEVPVKLRQGQQDSLPLFKTETDSEAQTYAEELNGLLNGVYEMRTEEGGVMMVKLRAEKSVAQQTPDLADVLHYDDVMYSLSRLGINLDVHQRELLVKKVTAQNSRARSNLMRAGVPGFDADVVLSASAFLEQQSYVAANKQFRHQFDSILEKESNWKGDQRRVAELKAALDAAHGPERELLLREYNQEKYWLDNATSFQNGVKFDQGNWYKERAKSMLAWLDSTGETAQVDDIWENTEWAMATRTAAAIAQLGGSIATGIAQVLSLPTNSWSYLASYNGKKNYGLGLGAGKAGMLLASYARKAANIGYANGEYLDARIKEATAAADQRDKNGLTLAELNFINDLTEQQRLDAAQVNSLRGTTRGKKGWMGNPNVQKAIQTWMTPFSYSEQFNRRVTVLAAYRGEFDRQMAVHGDANKAELAARKAATAALDTTQGDYAQYTRPAFFRGGVPSFIYMYKQYPIMMLQLLKNMNAEGRIIMIGSLILLSGIRGLPGIDDVLDIADGLCQALGLKMGSVEKEFMRLTNEAFGPEIGQEVNTILLRGLLDRATGLSFSNRLGLGDIIPGTSLLKPSATKQEMLRELENLAGAPTSFLVGVANYAATIAGVALGNKSASALLSDNPVRAFKNLGDAWKYAETGSILDSKGYVVAKNASAWEIAGKAMGFYPSRAQVQQDWLAADSQEQEYAKMVRTEFVRQAVAAKLKGDTATVREIQRDVAEWNKSTKGTRMELNNFDKSVTNAYREAKNPLAVRALKSSSSSGREEAKQLLRLYGADEATINGIP